MLQENELCLKMEVWAFEVLSFEIEIFDYLTNIDEKFLFAKSFDVVYVLELIENGLGLFWDDLGSHDRQFYRIWNFTEFTTNDQLVVQWLV